MNETWSMKVTKPNGEKIEIIPFWQLNKPWEEFSNWYESKMNIDGIEYDTVEKYMMAMKAKLFGDFEVQKEIMKTTHQAKIKALGRKVRNFDPVIWDNHKYQIVYKGNYEKFTQHQDLKERLLSTGDAILVEASPYDKVWGIGSNDPKVIADESLWKGENLLGKILMEVRDDIRMI